MPLSIDFPTITAAFRAPLDAQTAAIQGAFRRLGAWLNRRLAAARSLESSSRAFPVVDFYNGALTVRIDRSQRQALGETPEQDLGSALSEGGQRFLAGVGGVSDAVQAGLAIPRLLRAAADLLERVSRFLRRPSRGGTGRQQIGRLLQAYRRWSALGTSGMADALIAYAPRLPRLAASVAVTLTALSQFIRALGSGRAAALQTFTGGLEALGATLPEVTRLFPASTPSGAERSLPERLRAATELVTLALLALPWLGLNLSRLLPLASIGVRQAALDLLQRFEGHAWDFRRAVLELFFVRLPDLAREGLRFFDGAYSFLMTQLTFYFSFAELYLAELFDNLRSWGRDVGELLGRVTTIIGWLGMVMTALLDYNLLVLLLPLPSLVLSLGNLIEAAIEGFGGAMAYVDDVLRAAEALAPADVASRIRQLRQLLRLPPSLQPLPPEPRAPRIAPFPQLFETLLGPGRGVLYDVFVGARDATRDAVRDLLDSGTRLIVDTERTFHDLRDQAGRVDLSGRFRDMVESAYRSVEDLMAPEYAWLSAHAEPTGLEGLAGSLEAALALGGFHLVGAAIPHYVRALREFWQSQPEEATQAAAPPTSPQILARRAQLSRVLVPSVSIRAPRRALDGELSRELLAHFRSAVSAAFRNGEAQFAVQAVGAR